MFFQVTGFQDDAFYFRRLEFFIDIQDLCREV